MNNVYLVKSQLLEGDESVLDIFSSPEKARAYILKELIQFPEDGYKESPHIPNCWFNGRDSYLIEEKEVK